MHECHSQAFSSTFSNVMALVENQDAVLNYAFIPLENVFVEDVGVRHQNQVSLVLDCRRVIVRTGPIFFADLFLVIQRDGFILEVLHEYSHAFLFPLLPLLEIWASFRCKLLFVFEGDFLLYLLLGTHAFNFGQSSFVLRIISASPIQLLLLQIAIQGVVATHLLPPPKNHHVRSEAGLLQLFFHLLQLSMCPRQIDHSYPIKCFLVQLLIQNRVSLFQVREPREHRVEQAKSFASPSG